MLLIYLPLPHPGDSVVKEPACQCRGLKRRGFDPCIGKIPRSRKSNPLQYSCLENSMDRRAWQAIVYGISKSWTRLSTHALPPPRGQGHVSEESWHAGGPVGTELARSGHQLSCDARLPWERILVFHL